MKKRVLALLSCAALAAASITGCSSQKPAESAAASAEAESTTGAPSKEVGDYKIALIHREYKITDMDIFRNCSGRAYTDQRLNTVSFDQFMRINSDRRTAHSCSHDRNRFVAVKSGVAEHISCSIELFRTGKEIFSYKFCAERITRK